LYRAMGNLICSAFMSSSITTIINHFSPKRKNLRYFENLPLTTIINYSRL
jgi:hypothetical protein